MAGLRQGLNAGTHSHKNCLNMLVHVSPMGTTTLYMKSLVSADRSHLLRYRKC